MRQTRRKETADEKIRIVPEDLRGEDGINDLCQEGRHPFHDLSQMEQGVPRRREKTDQRGHYPGGSDEVKELRTVNDNHLTTNY